MFDSQAELLDKIRLGEDSLLELKAVRFSGTRISGPSRNDLADELAAFGNYIHGVLLLGVDDRSRGVEGVPVERLDQVEDLVREVVNDSIRPPLAVRIERLELPDEGGQLKPVLKVEIPRSLFVHRSPGGYLYRLGSSKREMSPELLARLFQQRSQAAIIRFDEQAVPDASPEVLKEPLWRRYVPDTGDDETLLRKLRLVVPSDEPGRWRASVGGVLTCCPAPEEWLSGARIEAVQYRGTARDANYQVDAKTITGPLDRQIVQAVSWIKSRMRVTAEKRPERLETPQFSHRAIFEAVVNAVAHRDYSVYGSAIRVFLFDDRLEIFSPGALPNTMDVDSLPLRQFTRNELVASLLARVPAPDDVAGTRGAFMEKRGEGVPLILGETRSLAGTDATYESLGGAELLLTLPSAPVL